MPDPDYRLTLRPLPSSIAPAIRLRALLKYALRACRLRCVHVEELPADSGATRGAERPADASVDAANGMSSASGDGG